MMMMGKNFFIIALKNIFLFLSSCLFLIKLILWFIFSFIRLVFVFLFRFLFNFFFFFTKVLFKFIVIFLLCIYSVPLFNKILTSFKRGYNFTIKIMNFFVIKQFLFLCRFVVLAFKLILIFLHVYIHKHSNIYRTILFILQYKYFSLLCKLWYLHFKKLIYKYINNDFILKIPVPYIKNTFIFKPITFSFFWYFFVLVSSIISIFIVIGWAFIFYMIYLSFIFLYTVCLFFSIFFNYIYLHFKNKFLFIYLFFLKIRLESFISVNNYITQNFSWKKIYLYRKLKHQNNQQAFLLNSFWYNISLLLLTLHLNNTIKEQQFQIKYNLYSNKYLESVDSSIFFKQKASLSKLHEQKLLLKNKLYVNHEKTWKELGLVGDNLYSRELDWQKNLLLQLTNRRDFYFFQKIKNYFSGKLNKTWDKFKITTIIDTYDDFTYYNNANVRLDHFFGDMAVGSEEVGTYKQKKYSKSKRVFLSLFKPKIQQKTLFDLEDDQNIVGLHKQNKISFLTWKVFYFLLRKHREFQWSAKRLRSVYKKESFDSNKTAGLWNKSKNSSLYKYHRLSWPSFFSKVLPSVFYSFSFLHDIFFSFFVEFLNDFFKSQFNILKLSYNLKNTLSLNVYNKTLYHQFVIIFIKIFWFIIYDLWKYFILLGFKIKWNILYILNQPSLLKFTLEYTLKWLVYFIQYLKLNDYYLISHLSCYKWENFLLFKIKSYLNIKNKKVDKFSYYYKYGYFLLILDFLLFFFFYFFLFLYDFIKILWYFVLFKKIPLSVQKKVFFFFRVLVFLINYFVYLPLYQIYSFKLYFDFFFDLIYSKKYNYLSIKEKRYHMQRYNIQTDLQGNWLESNYLTSKIVKFFLFLKILNKYWWSVSIQNKKNLERWPFFYNWFKLLPEIFFLYKILNITLFFISYFFKKIWFCCYDLLIINFFFIKSAIFFSFFFTIKYLYWFIKMVCYEWFLYVIFFNLTSKCYKKAFCFNKKLEGNADKKKDKIISFNKKYTFFFIINRYLFKNIKHKNSIFFNKTLKNNVKKENQQHHLSAVESFESLYSQYDNIIKINEKVKSKNYLNKDLILSKYLLNEVQSFFFYTNLSSNHLSNVKKININDYVSVRKVSLQNQTQSLNIFKEQVIGVVLDKLWFMHFLYLTKKLTLFILKTKNYNFIQKSNADINNLLVNLVSYKISYQEFLNTSKFNKLIYFFKFPGFFSKQIGAYETKTNKKFEIFKTLDVSDVLNQQNYKKKYINYNYLYFLSKKHNIILHKLLTFSYHLKMLFMIEFIFFIKFIFCIKKYNCNKNIIVKKINPTADTQLKWKQFGLWLHVIVLYQQIKVGKTTMGLVNFIWFVLLYKMLIVEWKIDFSKNQYIPVTNKIKFNRINWYLEKYFYLYRKRSVQEIRNLNYSKNIQNFIYWQQYLFSDIINTPTKTMVIDNFLGVSYKKQFTLNCLIKEEIILLEQQGFFNENNIKDEWKILNINYFLYLKTQIKSLFLYNFSSSRVNLNFKILRILFANWYLRKRSKKFTRYFWNIFKMSSQAYNLTRRNVSAPWHVFFGSNFSGESHRSFHKYNIKKKDNTNNTIKERWANFIESIHNYNKNDSIIKHNISKFLSNIFPSKKSYLNNFKKESLKNLHFTSKKDFFIKKENILNKRVFLGFFFPLFVNNFSWRYKIKIKFFLWKNYSKTRFFIIPAILFFWICCFGIPLFFNFEVLVDSFIWIYQLGVVVFEQWFGLYLLTPFVFFSNYLLIDWCVFLNSILDPIILQVYFIDVNFFFFQFDLVKIFLDWFFLTINNPYIIADYSILKTFYNFCLILLYIGLYITWSFYLQITWITFIYINYILTFFGISCSIFFWNFFLYWIKNILLFFFYSIYVSYKINLSFVIFCYTLVIKYLFYDFNQLMFIYIHYNEHLPLCQTYLIFIENNLIDYFNSYLIVLCNIIKNSYNIAIFFFNFIFYCCLYFGSYYKTCIIYYCMFLKYWIIQIKSWFFYKIMLYFIYIFQDLIIYELIDYTISIWLWLYFNCLYYLIVYPVKILCSCFFIFIKNIFLFLYWFPYYLFLFGYNFCNLFITVSVFFYTQFFLLYNFVSFIFFTIFSGFSYLIEALFWFNLNIISYLNIFLTNIVKMLLFPYYFCYKLFFKLGLNFFVLNFMFQLKALYYLLSEFILFFIQFIWNGISGIWGVVFLINDTLLYIFPELDKFFYPFGGFSIFYAIFYYYLFIVFSVLWSRSFRIFNDTSKEVPVPDYVWDQVRFNIEGSNIYSLLPLHVYKLLWIEKLSTNTNTNIPKELLDSLDTWTIQEKRLSYQLLVRLEDTPLNFQGFYYKYFTDLTRPFVIKYYRQKFAIKTYLRGVIPWRVYKVLIRRLRYSIWLWYVEGYLAYVTEEEPDAILSVGPSVSDIAGREANFDGQFDVLLKDDAIIEKVKRLKLYNFYFSKKDNTSVGIAHDVWLTFPIIGHVFGRDHLKKIKAMKNREAFIFEFIPEGNQNKGLTAHELAIKNYYINNWTRLNAESIWTITSNKGYGNGATYIEPNEKVLDLKANPQNYKLNRYVKVDEDDGINPDFFNDFLYLGSRSLDLLLTPFLTFAAVNTAWWNQENGMLNASYRFLELSDLADLLVTDYIKNEIKVRSPYKIIRQHFLSSFSSGEFKYEFLNLNDEDIELIKYGQPLIAKNQDAIKTHFSDEIVSYFPKLQEKLEFQGSKSTIKNLVNIPDASSVVDDVLVNIFKEYVIDQTIYDRWGSSLKDLLLYTYSLPEEDIKAISGDIKAELLDNVYNLKNEQFTLDMFINSLRNMFIDEILYNTSKAQWESAFTSHIVNKSQGLEAKEMLFGRTLKFRYPKLYDKEIEFGRDLSLFEKWRRMHGAAKEKLLEATTASYDVYGDRSLTSELMYKGTHYNYKHALYNYTSNKGMNSQELDNLVFINYFSENDDKIVLNKGALSQMADLGLLSLNKKAQSGFSIRTESGFRGAPVEYSATANRFEIEERDRVLEFLRPQINNIVSGIEQHFLTNPDPSMVNLFEESANELFIAKLLLKTTSSSPAFGYFLQYYFLQRLLTLYITAYEGTWFGQLLYFFTRSILVRLPVTGIDILPLIALDINNQSDIYYFPGFYGLPRLNHLHKEFLIPYTQYTYTQHYLLKSLQQQTLLYFTDRQKFFQQLPSNVVNVDWTHLPYLHPDLDVNRRLRMVYQHIYSASFHYPNVYNEGFLLFKIREFVYALGLEVWLTELKDVFTINNWFLSGGLSFFTHIISFNFWTSFFRSDWVVFVENNQKWFEFTFHLLGYFKQPIDLYKLAWYSIHILEYTKTFILLILDITVYLCFPNVSFDFLKIDVWIKIFKSLKANLKLSLLIFENWWYNNFWVYRWCLDITNWLVTSLNINDISTYSLGSFYPYNTWFSTIIHFCAYWKDIDIFLPSVMFPKIILNISNLLRLDLYNIFSIYFIDKGLVTIIPLNKQTAYSFFLTHPTSFLYYNIWYDYYLNTFNITKADQEMFLSQLLRKSLNKRYDLRYQPVLLRENIMSPYSFKINYGNHFLTTYEVNLLYNTNFYKQETIALYHAFDFLLTNPSNAVFYKNFVEIGDSKNNEIGFLFNFQSLYQDLTAMYISTNILKSISVETFYAFKTYEEQLNISNLRFFYYYYYYFNQNYKVIRLSENLPIIKVILDDCVKKNIIIDDKFENWAVMFDKNTFTVHSDLSDPGLYFLLKKNIDGSFEIYLQRLR